MTGDKILTTKGSSAQIILDDCVVDILPGSLVELGQENHCVNATKYAQVDEQVAKETATEAAKAGGKALTKSQLTLLGIGGVGAATGIIIAASSSSSSP